MEEIQYDNINYIFNIEEQEGNTTLIEAINGKLFEFLHVTGACIKEYLLIDIVDSC